MEKPVKFMNKKNQYLFGIIHIPENNSDTDKKEGVIFVHSGGTGRIGYGRLYVHYARRLCNEGFYVLRFDPHGMGDSEGTIPNCSWSTFWSKIQTGLYIDDVLTAIEFFTHEEGIHKITLIGLCAGAVSALLTAGKYSNVDSLILIGIPVLIDDSAVDYQGEISALYYRSNVIKKVISFENWKRFITLKADYGHILRLAILWLKKEFKKPKKNTDTKLTLNTDRPDFNRYVLTAFINFMNRKKRILFIYGTNDVYFKEFQNEFRHKYLLQNDKHYNTYDIYTIEEANHMLTQKKWQDDAIEKILDWLKGNHQYDS